LHPTPEQAKSLSETLTQFTVAFNEVCAYGWQHSEKNGVRLHHAMYYATKETCPGLVSDLLIQARVKATEALKSAFDRKAKGRKVHQPRSRFCPARYNEKTYTLHWDAHSVRLSTSTGKQSIPFTVPAYSVKYQDYKIATADLCYRKGDYWLHVVVSVPEPDVVPLADVIGVDLGLNRPAVTSHRQFLGNPHWKEVDRRRFRLRRALQSKGTRSAKRHLKKLSGQSLHFHRDCDHVLSKSIVQHAIPGSTIVIENLKDIRSTSKITRKGETKRRLHSWSFAQFKTFLVYKAEEKGCQVVKIDPRHTSQTCSKCGHQHRSNRKSQALFLCKHCGYCLNADLNASYNIRNKHLASLGTPLAGASPCQAAFRLDSPSGEPGTSPRL
jgi:IS605 OrfB family transposase